MILGNYPCCEGELTLGMPERSPAYAREECPHCGTVVWHRLSRIDPQSWTEEAFLAEHEVNDETRKITLKNPPPELDPVISGIIGRFVSEQIAKEIIGEVPLTPPATLGAQLRERYGQDPAKRVALDEILEATRKHLEGDDGK